eukprot:4777045-Prymnesium_polylepis.1
MHVNGGVAVGGGQLDQTATHNGLRECARLAADTDAHPLGHGGRCRGIGCGGRTHHSVLWHGMRQGAGGDCSGSNPRRSRTAQQLDCTPLEGEVVQIILLDGLVDDAQRGAEPFELATRLTPVGVQVLLCRARAALPKRERVVGRRTHAARLTHPARLLASVARSARQHHR